MEFVLKQQEAAAHRRNRALSSNENANATRRRGGRSSRQRAEDRAGESWSYGAKVSKKSESKRAAESGKSRGGKESSRHKTTESYVDEAPRKSRQSAEFRRGGRGGGGARVEERTSSDSWAYYEKVAPVSRKKLEDAGPSRSRTEKSKRKTTKRDAQWNEDEAGKRTRTSYIITIC